MMENERRKSIKTIVAAVAGVLGTSLFSKASFLKKAGESKKIKNFGKIVKQNEVPLFSSVVKHGDLVFVAGIGAHFKGDIKSHTEHVLNELKKTLEGAGSSMEKVLKASVFLHDLDDYDGMNEVYKGKFGEHPPVRTTVAVGGVPGASLVEIDVVAYI